MPFAISLALCVLALLTSRSQTRGKARARKCVFVTVTDALLTLSDHHGMFFFFRVAMEVLLQPVNFSLLLQFSSVYLILFFI